MRNGLLGTIAAWACGAGLAFAQPPQALPPAALPGAAAPGAAMGPGGLPMGNGLLSPFDGGGPGAAPGLLNGFGEAPSGLNSEAGWVSAEYLLWFLRSMPSPQPLITTGTTAGGGQQGNIGTAAVYGAENFDFNPFSGGRFSLGRWFKSNPRWGAEWAGFVLANRVDSFTLATQDQVIARPFIDADTGLPNSFLVAFPGYATGNVTAAVRSQLWGLEWNLHRRVAATANRRLNVLVGFRYLDLHEDLSVTSNSFFLPGAVVNYFGQVFNGPFADRVSDSIDTRNQYMMGQIGFQGDVRYNRWTFTGGMKLGLGGVYQSIDITGETAIRVNPGDPETVGLGGLLAADSNIGRSNTGHFVVMPEGKVQASYRFCSNMDLGLGYTFTYLSHVIRPSEQIDPQLSTTRIPTSAFFGFPGGANRPAVPYNQGDMWVQGLNVALTIRY